VIVDSSALVAITFREPGHQQLIEKVTGAPSAGIGTPTLAETGQPHRSLVPSRQRPSQ